MIIEEALIVLKHFFIIPDDDDIDFKRRVRIANDDKCKQCPMKRVTRHFRAFHFREDISAQTFQRMTFSRTNIPRMTLSRYDINALTH